MRVEIKDTILIIADIGHRCNGKCSDNMKKLSVFDKSVLALALACLLVMGVRLVCDMRTGDDGVRVEQKADPMENAQAWREGSETDGLLEGEIMDLNTASLSDLTRLPGIGAGRAQDVIDWREKHGGFASVEELTKIKGIGTATLEKLRPYVRAGN